ncbi:hypothetical protein H0H81_010646 [Sphagnurus paluster]|uniref:Uncharacterized protein n=1 Tax=Sphagnurus paluster TaxID=117069 RepID=A0A9P7K3P4_9AGAR|nr:hypothetical protein H0H81_010646 [Sphagnurus paluster]
MEFDDDSDLPELTDTSEDEVGPSGASGKTKANAKRKSMASKNPHLQRYHAVTYSTKSLAGTLSVKSLVKDNTYCCHRTNTTQFDKSGSRVSARSRRQNREIWYDSVPQGRKGISMKPGAKVMFDTIQISVYEYDCITDHDEREVFQRVQNGVALSAHERLRAINGPHADLIRQMHQSTTEQLQLFLAWGDAKGKDFFMLSQLACFIHNHLAKVSPPATTSSSCKLKAGRPKKANPICPTAELKLPRVEIYLGSKTPPTTAMRTTCLRTIQILNLLIADQRWRAGFKGIKPLWFVMAGFLIHLHSYSESSSLNIGQLGKAIALMREIGKDATAAKAYKDLVKFVTDVGTMDLPGVGSLAHSVSWLPSSSSQADISQPASASESTGISKTETTPKRKRGDKEYVDSVSEVQECTPPKKKATLSTRHTVRRIVESQFDDEKNEPESEDEALVRSTAPKNSNTSAARKSVKMGSGSGSGSASKAIGAVDTSKAITKVKKKKLVSTSAPAKPYHGNEKASASDSQGGAVSTQVRPSASFAVVSRAKKPTKADVVGAAVMTSLNQRNESMASTSESYMPTPPASVTPAPAPVPTYVSSLPSGPQTSKSTNNFSSRPSPHEHIKAEPSHSPVHPAAPLPGPINRLAALHAAKAQVASSNSQASLLFSPTTLPTAQSEAQERYQCMPSSSNTTRNTTANFSPISDVMEVDPDLEEIKNSLLPRRQPPQYAPKRQQSQPQPQRDNVMNGIDPLAQLVPLGRQKAPPFQYHSPQHQARQPLQVQQQRAGISGQERSLSNRGAHNERDTAVSTAPRKKVSPRDMQPISTISAVTPARSTPTQIVPHHIPITDPRLQRRPEGGREGQISRGTLNWHPDFSNDPEVVKVYRDLFKTHK